MLARAVPTILFALPAVLVAILAPPALAAPSVTCSLIPVEDEVGADLGDRFQYHVDAGGTEPLRVESTLLVLDREANVLQEIPVEEGDVFQLQLRDEVKILEMNGQVKWLVHAPGVLFRARASETYESALAYCSPFAAIRVDQPENLAFGSSPSSPDAPVRLTIGFAQMDPASIAISIDCVDVIALAGAVIPGGPFDGSGMIAGETVQVTDFVSDLGQGTISFNVLGLPGGGHKVAVSGTPTYIDDLPRGSVHWTRPLGALSHAATIAIFRAEIEVPLEAATLPLAPVEVRGVLTHGLPIAGLRVHGAATPLPPEQFTPATECLGEVHRIEFTTSIPVADLRRDFATGDDATSALDPGVNYLSIIGTDGVGTTAGDRVRFTLGAVETPLSAFGPVLASEPCPPECAPIAEVPGHVSNGFAVSISERAVNQSVVAKVLPILQIQMTSTLASFEGQALEAIVNACPEEPYGLSSVVVPRHPEREPTTLVAPPRADQTLGNEPPVFDPPIPATHEVERTKELTITLAATDPDGDALTFSLGEHPANSDLFENRFTFTPTCDQLGAFTVELIVSDGIAQTMATTEVTVVDGNEDIPLNPRVDDIVYDSGNMTMNVTFPDANGIRLGVDTGPLTMHMSIDECFVDCLLCCCCGVEVNFSVQIPNIHVDATLTPQQLACGVADGEAVSVVADVEPATVEFGDPHFGCLSCFIDLLLPGTGFFIEFLNLFDVPASALDEFAAPLIEERVNDEIKQAIEDEFAARAADLAGLLQFEPSTTLPPESPLTLSLCSTKVPLITASGSLSLGLHSDFDPVAPPDPEPEWVPTPSAFTGAETLGADLALEVSDDAVNQLFSALAATGTLRQQFSGITLGTLAPAIDPTSLELLEALGLTPDTPLLLTVDLAQGPGGEAIPPIFGFVDDPASPELEVKVRAQLLVRAIAERGGTVTDDRAVCSCMDLSCSGEPCLLLESLLKLNFLVDVSLSGAPPGTTTLQFVVTEIQQLNREEGFDAMETVDLASTEDDVVATSADSPVLELVRTELNTRLPTVDVPEDALTLQGFVAPINLRLFSRTVDDAGLGLQDYVGIIGDVEIAPPPAALATREVLAAHRASTGDGRPGRTAEARPTHMTAPQIGAEQRALEASFGEVTNFPNPFRGSTSIRLTLAQPGLFEVAIHDLRGQLVRRETRVGAAGPNELNWDGADQTGRPVAAGVYFLSVRAASQLVTRRMIMLR